MRNMRLTPLLDQAKTPYRCGVLGCGNGCCIQAWIPYRCPHSGQQLVCNTANDFVYCSGGFCHCEFEGEGKTVRARLTAQEVTA